MKRYRDAKFECYINNRRISLKNDVPGFKHINAKKQIDFKIRKREHDTERHGKSAAEELLKVKKGPKLTKLESQCNEETI